MMLESVWDYPRPPAAMTFDGLVEVVVADITIVATHDSVRVLETSHPPVFYLPVCEFPADVLRPVAGRQSYCEFKGLASYWDVVVGAEVREAAAWGYDDPSPGFEVLLSRVALYPGRMDACFINGEQVLAQEGDFYGGWITAAVVGPVKGGPGTTGW
jgi:uncharacterized protein (DUF427 family)